MIENVGIVSNNGVVSLDKKFKPLRFYIYYGELATSGILDYSDYTMMAVSDTDPIEIAKGQAQGCKFFNYIYFGSRFEDSDEWEINIKAQIDVLHANNIDGIFLDEVDAEYWELGYSEDQIKVEIFKNRLQEICDYITSLGMESIVNGSAYYAECGNYYLWESFVGVWGFSSYELTNVQTRTRTANANGTINYQAPLNETVLSGDLEIRDNAIKMQTGSSGNGTIVFTFDTQNMLENTEISTTYDWIFTQYYGSGGTDINCVITAKRGNTLPVDSTWVDYPPLWKGEAESWDGLGFSSKYIQITMTLTNAPAFTLNRLQVNFTFTYFYQNMIPEQGSQYIPTVWGYNTDQRDWLWNNIVKYDNTKVLCHSYGPRGDTEREKYIYACAKIWDFPYYDYVNPMHQSLYPTVVYKNAWGKLLSRTDDNTGVFTNATLSVDLVTHELTETHTKPSYYYNVEVDMETGIGLEVSDIVDENLNDSETTVWGYHIGDGALVKDIKISDDWDNIYLSFTTKDIIDTSSFSYEIYLNLDGITDTASGYIGEWFAPTTGVRYKIQDHMLFMWDDTYTPRTSYSGFYYKKVMDYKISDDGKTVVYMIPKNLVGNGNMINETINCFMTVTEKTLYMATFIPKTYTLSDKLYVTTPIVYTQKVYNKYVPHGYFEGDKTDCMAKTAITVTWDSVTNAGTNVSCWCRVYSESGWSEWYAVNNNIQLLPSVTFTKYQYLFGLNSADGINTPSVSNITVTVSDAVPIKIFDYLEYKLKLLNEIVYVNSYNDDYDNIAAIRFYNTIEPILSFNKSTDVRTQNFQITVRDTDFLTAHIRAENIINSLDNCILRYVSTDGKYHTVTIRLKSDIMHNGNDEKNRSILTINFKNEYIEGVI